MESRVKKLFELVLVWWWYLDVAAGKPDKKRRSGNLSNLEASNGIAKWVYSPNSIYCRFRYQAGKLETKNSKFDQEESQPVKKAGRPNLEFRARVNFSKKKWIAPRKFIIKNGPKGSWSCFYLLESALSLSLCLSDELCSHLNGILPLSILGFLKLMNHF